MKKLCVILLAVLFATMPILAFAYEYEDEYEEEYIRPLYYAGATAVMCAQTGELIYAYRPHQRFYPASLVKVMTALLVLEHVENLNQVITLSETAADLPWYAAHMGLTAGDTFTVLQGLYGNLLPSANEVANALAEHVAGSIPAFVQMMNARAVELGAYNTRFVNACGLPGDGQFITAYDMSLIMREAVRHDVFVQIINAPYFHFPPIYAFPEGRTIRNTNQLIRPETDFFHPDIIGGKTGWIIVAQNTLSTYSRRRDSGLIVTVLYTERRDDTFLDTVALMDLGFNWMFYGPPEVKPSSEAPAVDFPVIPLPPPDDPLHTPDNPYDTADSPSEDDTDTVGAFPDWCEAQRSNALFPNSPAYTLHLILAVAFSLFVGIVCAIALFPRRKK